MTRGDECGAQPKGKAARQQLPRGRHLPRASKEDPKDNGRREEVLKTLEGREKEEQEQEEEEEGEVHSLITCPPDVLLAMTLRTHFPLEILTPHLLTRPSPASLPFNWRAGNEHIAPRPPEHPFPRAPSASHAPQYQFKTLWEKPHESVYGKTPA
ncbi:hypothetical protein E2C01_047017 [Portunus trituberculatus]|uniref:Uncharacterized protein n=1 Tax=Portunus trituberculatus TaxID=210409 RepID=A0A5B7G2I1_PORTR|nr:hypothetical protein [Portunus trituberculatus]